MFTSKTLLHQLTKEVRSVRKCTCSIRKRHKRPSPENFKLERAFIVTKSSRYEYEQMRHPQLNKEQLEAKLKERGTDFELLLHLHNLHKKYEQRVAESFKNSGCEVKIANRVEFRRTITTEIVKWADVIVPVGGDGTFLLAAGRASPLFGQYQQKIPIVGFNSNIQNSEGRLLLPKGFSEQPEDAVKRIKCGNFQWMYRTRIRCSFFSNTCDIPTPTDLYRHKVRKMEQQKIEPELLDAESSKKYRTKMKRVLPYLALNEVFIGEQIAARVSHLQLMIDDENIMNKTKCSGLCVSTGTGSTSWHTSINRITKNHVKNLVGILPNANNYCMTDSEAEVIAEKYNKNLIFAPEDPRLCYSVREQICGGVWPQPKEFESQKFVKSLFISSRCIDASLVIDGNISYPFNDGAKVLLEVHPEDMLLTLAFD